MKQQVVEFEALDGLTASHRKEKSFYKSHDLVALIEGKIRSIVSLRFYETASRIYCCVFIKYKDYANGSGYAGGGGYHLESAAAANAFESAGIDLKYSISGIGSEAIEDALLAFGRFVGLDTVSVISSYA